MVEEQIRNQHLLISRISNVTIEKVRHGEYYSCTTRAYSSQSFGNTLHRIKSCTVSMKVFLQEYMKEKTLAAV